MSNVEDKARSQGWVPQEEWQGEADQWVDAREFVYRGELMERISKQNRELKQLRNNHKTEVTELKKKMLKMGEQWTKDKLENLEADLSAAEQAYEDAIRDEDNAKAGRIKEYINKLRDDKAEATTASEEIEQDQKTSDTGLSPLQEDVIEYVRSSFIPENPWYGKDIILTTAFNAIGDQLVATGNYDSGEDLVNDIYKQLREELPNKFDHTEDEVTGDDTPPPAPKNPQRAARQEPTHSASPVRKRNSGFRELTADETQVMNNFVRNNIMTKDEYIKSLKDVEGM